MNERTTIDDYLDRLADALRTGPRATRRILAEVEDHLRLAADAAGETGMDPAAAESQAIRQFGTVAASADGFNRQARPPLPTRVEAIATPLVGMFAIGLVAIGVSGIVALVIGLAAGKPFVSGDPPGATYTAERCADFMEYYPDAPDCASAAVSDHFDEVVVYRGGAGLLGVMALAAYFAVRRARRPTSVPSAFVPTVGASVFGVAGLGFLMLGGAPLLLGSSNGAGQYLSAGVVALPVGLAYSWRLLPFLLPSPE